MIYVFFCGKKGCEIEIKISSRKSNKRFFKILKCDCLYYFDYGQKKSFSKKNRTSNHLILCEIKGCNSVIWTFNIKNHFEVKHPDEECPELNITEEELKYLGKTNNDQSDTILLHDHFHFH